MINAQATAAAVEVVSRCVTFCAASKLNVYFTHAARLCALLRRAPLSYAQRAEEGESGRVEIRSELPAGRQRKRCACAPARRARPPAGAAGESTAREGVGPHFRKQTSSP